MVGTWNFIYRLPGVNRVHSRLVHVLSLNRQSSYPCPDTLLLPMFSLVQLQILVLSVMMGVSQDSRVLVFPYSFLHDLSSCLYGCHWCCLAEGSLSSCSFLFRISQEFFPKVFVFMVFPWGMWAIHLNSHFCSSSAILVLCLLWVLISFLYEAKNWWHVQ